MEVHVPRFLNNVNRFSDLKLNGSPLNARLRAVFGEFLGTPRGASSVAEVRYVLSKTIGITRTGSVHESFKRSAQELLEAASGSDEEASCQPRRRRIVAPSRDEEASRQEALRDLNALFDARSRC